MGVNLQWQDPRCLLFIPCRALTLNEWEPVLGRSSETLQLSWLEQGPKGTKVLWIGAERFALFPPKRYMFVEHSHG